MKRVRIAVLCASILWVIVASVSFGYLMVAWSANEGFYFPGNPSQGILTNGESTIAQLIFSVDAVADPVDINNSAGGYVSGDDVLLAEITLTSGSNCDEWAYFGAQNYTGAYSAGYIFGRIFEDNTPAIGERYFNGPIETAEDRSPPQSPQSYDFNSGPDFGDDLDQVIPIPEPLSAALYGLGTLLILHRRRKA